MVQKNGVLTREDNRISRSPIRRVMAQENYPAITETEMSVKTIDQTWILETGEKASAGGTTPRLAHTLLRIVNWLSHVGAEKVDDRHLESRHNMRQNFRAKGIGL